MNWLFYGSRIHDEKNFKLSHTDPSCVSRTCQCDWTIEGTNEVTKDWKKIILFNKNGVHRTQEQMCEELSLLLSTEFDFVEGVVIRRPQTELLYRLRSMIRSSSSLREVSGPFPFRSPVLEAEYFPAEGLEAIIRAADREHWETTYTWRNGFICSSEEWNEVIHSQVLPTKVHRTYQLCQRDEALRIITQEEDAPCPTLQSLCLRTLSHWRMAYGLVNGRLPYINTLNNFTVDKTVELMTKFSQPTRANDRTKELAPYFFPAMDRLYYAMGTTHLFGTQDIKIDIARELSDMYVGSAHGLSPGESEEYKLGADTLKKSSTGKKFEELEAVLKDLEIMFTEGVRPLITWKVSAKLEHLFSWTKQLTDAQYFAWQKKCRFFIIPNTQYILLERLVSKVRHLAESGRVIRIRSKWVWGGADWIAKLLHTYSNPHKRIWEGDFEGLDLSIKDILTEMYFGSMLYYFKKDDPFYPIAVEIVKFLAEECTQRLTALWESLWVIMAGKVPSGCFNTSHFDSWAVALLYFTFVVHQYSTMSMSDRLKIDDALMDFLIHIIVYGDDNNTSLPDEEFFDTYLGYHAWSSWLEHYWGMKLRDIKKPPFLSTAKGGWLTRVGTIWLKHHIIYNPSKKDGQAKYVPFRETREYVIRMVHGKEPGIRNLVDVLLSVLGHAYGTYGSNEDAYYFLRIVYRRILTKLKIHEGNVKEIAKLQYGVDDLKKWKRLDLTPQQLLQGFPSLELLRSRNEYRESVHNQDRIEADQYDFFYS